MKAIRPRWSRALPLAAVLALSGALASCGQGVSEPGARSASGGKQAAHSVTVMSCGKKVTVKTTPKRVVALTPGLSDLVKRLDAGKSVVAEAQNKTGKITAGLADEAKIISTTTPPARETLLATKPDLVLTPTGYELSADQGFASVDQLAKAGAVAYTSTGGCPTRRSSSEVTDLLTDIDAVGRILNREKEAKALHDKAQGELDAVDKAVAGKKKPTVVQVYVEGGKLSVIGAGVEYDIIKRAGGDNQFKPSDPQFKDFFSAEITKETLLAKNPEVIVFAGPDEKARKATREYLKNNFANVPAVKNNRLIELDSDELMPGTWENIDAVRTVAKGLHPDAGL